MRISDWSSDVCSSDLRAGAGIERALVGRGIEQVRIAPERRLGAVAVMHVEIHHRDAVEAVHRACMQRADSDVVEEAEAHGAVRLGVMARSEEHTSELQSLMRISYAVFCLKKKTTQTTV